MASGQEHSHEVINQQKGEVEIMHIPETNMSSVLDQTHPCQAEQDSLADHEQQNTKGELHLSDDRLKQMKQMDIVSVPGSQKQQQQQQETTRKVSELPQSRMNTVAKTMAKEINQQQQLQSNQGKLTLTVAETLQVDGNTQLLQGIDQQELDSLNVISAYGDQDITLENVNQNQVKELQDQALLDEDTSHKKGSTESLPPSKEWTPSEIDPSHNLHKTENLPVQSIDAAVQEFREVSVVNEQIINKNPLDVLEKGMKESINLEMGQGQYIVPQSKCNGIEKEVIEQNQAKSSPSVINIKKLNEEQSTEQYQISAEMQCSLQERSYKLNQVSRVKEQAKQMQNQQIKKQKTGVVGDNHERINYLVQVSRTLVNMGQSKAEPPALNFDKPLASQTGSLATAVGRKSLVRLSPSLKRVLCKGCGTMLIYGVNARVRQRSKRQRHLVITCLVCNTIRRLVCDVSHKLWCEQEEAVV